MRKTNAEIQELCNKFHTNRLWSFSRYNKYKTSKYEYFLNYIKKEPTDRNDCIYGVIGGMVHDILENLYEGKIKYEKLDEEFENAWATTQILGLMFDRNDNEKNDKIGNKYYYDLKHFFHNYKMLPYKMINEQFMTINIKDKYYFQGYIDNIFKDENGIYNILDYKTSTIYKGDKALKECEQLLLYALGLHQLGVPIDKIKIKWNFLKYVSVDCLQANGKITTREIERTELYSKLSSSVKMWLKKTKEYTDEQIEEKLEDFKLTNDLSVLPNNVIDKYTVKDCYIEIQLNEDMINQLITNIENVLDEIVEKEKEYDKTKDETLFYDDDESLEKNCYYYNVLCGYSINKLIPYKNYLDRKKAEQDANIFNGEEAIKVNNDMDWLNNL